MRDLSWPSRSPFTVDALLEFALSSPVSSYVLRGYALPVSRRLCFSLNNGFLSLALLPYAGGTPARALRLRPLRCKGFGFIDFALDYPSRGLRVTSYESRVTLYCSSYG